MSLRVREELFLLRHEVEEHEEQLRERESVVPEVEAEGPSDPHWAIWAIPGLCAVAVGLICLLAARHFYGRRYTDSVSVLGILWFRLGPCLTLFVCLGSSLVAVHSSLGGPGSGALCGGQGVVPGEGVVRGP